MNSEIEQLAGLWRDRFGEAPALLDAELMCAVLEELESPGPREAAAIGD